MDPPEVYEGGHVPDPPSPKETLETPLPGGLETVTDGNRVDFPGVSTKSREYKREEGEEG